MFLYDFIMNHMHKKPYAWATGLLERDTFLERLK